MEKHTFGRDPDSVELSRSKEGAQVIETTGMAEQDPPSASLFPTTVDPIDTPAVGDN